MRFRPSASGLVVLVVFVGMLGSVPLLSGAHAPATSITITNNSGKEILHVYLSPTDANTWSADQIEPSTISSGGSVTLNDVSCSAADIKVIAEDQDGCFYYRVATCGESTSWTIASNAVRDCGN